MSQSSPDEQATDIV